MTAVQSGRPVLAPEKQSRTSPNLGGGAGHLWGLVVVVLALAGAGLVLLSTSKYGAGLNRDSVEYFDAARGLVSGRGLTFHTGEPLVWWPPLYPMLLALVGFATRLDPSAFAHVVNAVLFALVILLSARLFQTGSRQSATYSLLSVCAVLLSVPLSGIYGWAMSECLFIPFVLLYLLSAQRYWDSGGMRSLAVMVLATVLASLTRYTGVALVPAGFVTVILASKVSIGSRIRRAFGFAVFSLAPLALWVVRNYALTGTPFGARFSLQRSLVENANRFVIALLSWYVPGLGHKTRLILLAGAAGGVLALVSSRAAREKVLSSLRAVVSDYPAAVAFLVTFPIILLMAATRDAWIDSRMLSPAYIPATLILLKLGSHLFGSSRTRIGAFTGRIPTALLALWLFLPLRNVVQLTTASIKNGTGLSDRSWRESATVARAKELSSAADPQPPVYSNDHWALWELARVNARLSPKKTMGFRSRAAAGKLGDLAGRWPVEGEAYLVWFIGEGGRDFLFSPEELSEITDIGEVARLPDGTIYRVSIKGVVGQPSRSQDNPRPNP